MTPPKPEAVEVTTFGSAVRGLTDRPYLRSQQHKDAVRFTDYSFASEPLGDFLKRLLRRAAKVGIPLYVESASYDVAFVVHGRRKRDLHPLEWQVIAHLGIEIANQYGLEVRWGGPMMASCWLGTAAGSI